MILIVAESNPFNILDHFDKSNDISRYAIFPLLLLVALIYLMMNFYLLWKWHTSGELDTNVNKLIGIQRTIGIFYSFGCIVDYFFRVYGSPVLFLSESTYCSCWMIYYKFLAYSYLAAHLAIAIIRFTCIKYPTEFQNRYLGII